MTLYGNGKDARFIFIHSFLVLKQSCHSMLIEGGFMLFYYQSSKYQ